MKEIQYSIDQNASETPRLPEVPSKPEIVVTRDEVTEKEETTQKEDPQRQRLDSQRSPKSLNNSLMKSSDVL